MKMNKDVPHVSLLNHVQAAHKLQLYLRKLNFKLFDYYTKLN